LCRRFVGTLFPSVEEDETMPHSTHGQDGAGASQRQTRRAVLASGIGGAAMLTGCLGGESTPTATPTTGDTQTDTPVATDGGAAADAPNVIQILVDDLGYGDLGAYGGERFQTPNMDALTESGVRCTAGYCTAPWCAPTRTSVLSGQYFNRPSSWERPWMGERMQSAGYRTGFIGKVHAHPVRHYDEFYGFYSGMMDYRGADGGPITLRRGSNPSGGIPKSETEAVEEADYRTTAFTRETVNFIEESDGDEPFHLTLHYGSPHSPLQAPQEYLDMYPDLSGDERVYAAMVTALDDGIGRILQALDDQNARENTMVTLLSDNGPVAAYQGGWDEQDRVSGGLRGSKHTFWEGGIRVPFVVSWPGQLEGGQDYDEVVSCMDLLPTFLSAAGVDYADDAFDGVNLLPYLSGDADGTPYDTLYLQRESWVGSRHAARQRRKNDTEATWIIRKDPWKLMGQGDEATHLYNLADDIAEQNNLIDSASVDVGGWASEFQSFTAEDWQQDYGPSKEAFRSR
jgi:arylsulfatase A-like enzyme